MNYSNIEISINKIMAETGISINKAISYYDMFFIPYLHKHATIEYLILRQESNEILKHFHQLKGTVVNLRLDGLSNIISEMEQYIKDGNYIKCKETHKVFLNEINKLKNQMNEVRYLL